MRKILVNLILIVLFPAILTIVMLPFIAELKASEAAKMESSYRWKRAGNLYREAARLDPFDAKYPALLGDFLLRQSTYYQDRAPWIKEAEESYRRASLLNQRCAKYFLKLGEITIENELYKKKTMQTKIERGSIDRAFSYFKDAIKNDPNGADIAYAVGYEGALVWKLLDDDEKKLVLNRLKYSIRQRPAYAYLSYLLIWKNTGDFRILQEITSDNLENNKVLYDFLRENNLWQFRKEQEKIVNSYRQKEEPAFLKREKREKAYRIEKVKQAQTSRGRTRGFISSESWQGISSNGKNIYENGQMYWGGVIDGIIDLPEGEAEIAIKMKGSKANNVWPYMIIELDGKVIGENFIKNTEWQEYTFKVITDGGAKVLSVTFPNDTAGGSGKEDRNLYVGEARFIGGLSLNGK